MTRKIHEMKKQEQNEGKGHQKGKTRRQLRDVWLSALNTCTRISETDAKSCQGDASANFAAPSRVGHGKHRGWLAKKT